MQNIFQKIDKKVLVIVGVILIIVLIAAFFTYKYSKDLEQTLENNEVEMKIEDPREQVITPIENQPNQNQPNNMPQVQLKPQESLTICSDKCGDGVCQPANIVCEDNLNCICAETKLDCPQDCR